MRKINRGRITRLLWVCAIIALGAWNGACTNYNRYNVAEATFEPQDQVIDAAVATGSLVFLGFEVDSATRDRVRTKWQTFYTDNGMSYQAEHTVRIVVDLQKGAVKGQCLTRKMLKYGREAPWRFKPCTNKHVLYRLNTAVINTQQLIGLNR